MSCRYVWPRASMIKRRVSCAFCTSLRGGQSTSRVPTLLSLSLPLPDETKVRRVRGRVVVVVTVAGGGGAQVAVGSHWCVVLVFVWVIV